MAERRPGDRARTQADDAILGAPGSAQRGCDPAEPVLDRVRAALQDEHERLVGPALGTREHAPVISGATLQLPNELEGLVEVPQVPERIDRAADDRVDRCFQAPGPAERQGRAQGIEGGRRPLQRDEQGGEVVVPPCGERAVAALDRQGDRLADVVETARIPHQTAGHPPVRQDAERLAASERCIHRERAIEELERRLVTAGPLLGLGGSHDGTDDLVAWRQGLRNRQAFRDHDPSLRVGEQQVTAFEHTHRVEGRDEVALLPEGLGGFPGELDRLTHPSCVTHRVGHLHQEPWSIRVSRRREGQCALEARHRGRHVEPERPLACEREGSEGFGLQARRSLGLTRRPRQVERGGPVVGEYLGEVLGPITGLGLEPLRCGDMSGRPRRTWQLGVGDIAGQDVPERVFGLAGHR